VIAGTGSNDTAYAISLTQFACDAGVDGVLLVTPYYNKATQNGLIKSFVAVANAATKPCFLYNVPSRTGCNLLPKTIAALADHPRITAVKEASGNISQIVETAALCGDKIDIYSGNDDQIVPILSLGGQGVISVLANVVPKATHELCQKWFDGDVKGSCAMQLEYMPLIHALFSEVNPIPVKAAMAAMGWCEDYLRLPLTSMTDAKKAKMLEIMKGHKLI
jgi:4-hydroxy-tetrahydrodipicolinate synthase